jgi:hypothetical protein
MNSREKRKFREKLRVAAAHLDDVELEGAFQAALRGDMDEVGRRMARVSDTTVEATQTVSWRESSSWLFNRRAFPKRSRL